MRKWRVYYSPKLDKLEVFYLKKIQGIVPDGVWYLGYGYDLIGDF